MVETPQNPAQNPAVPALAHKATHNAAMPLLAASFGIALLSVMDAAIKRASLESGVYMALLLRTGFSVAMVAPAWWLSGGRWPRSAVLRMHVLRGLVSTVTAASFFWGLLRTPLAEAIALSFIAPLIALWLAAVVLGERVRWPAVAAALLGLAGVVVIALASMGGQRSPGAGTGWGILAILASAALYAWNLILQRQQAQVSGPVEVALFQPLVMVVAFALLAPWLAHWPSVGTLGWAALAGALAAAGLAVISWAWGRAEAQVLLPMEYSAFVWAALAGWLMFGEAVTLPTLAGLLLILAGCRIGTWSTTPVMHTEQTGL